MKFREMIKNMQLKTGFSDKESKEALEHTVETVAVRLTEGERKDFASQLPGRLKAIAMSVMPTEENSGDDMLIGFMERQGIKRDRAKKQLLGAWEVLKEAISRGEINDIRAQLSNKTAAFLH